MSNVIKFQSKSKTKHYLSQKAVQERIIQEIKGGNCISENEVQERMCRIKETINKINKVMEKLKAISEKTIDLETIQFYVIYSFDCPRDISVNTLKPPAIHNWALTEKDEEFEFDYLGGDWKNGKHRKYVTKKLLSKKQFDAFINETGLKMEDIETMGSLTMELGHIPAFSFKTDDYNYICSAYVTPFLPKQIEGKEIGTEEEWNQLKELLLENYS